MEGNGERRDRIDLQIPRRLSRWALWGCVTLVLIGLLFGLGLFLTAMNTQGGRARWRWTQDVALCQEHLKQVAGALDRCHRDQGKLPERLEDVYPTYLQSDTNLRCPRDERKGPGTSYCYEARVGWGNSAKMVVWCPLHPPPPQAGPLLKRLTLPAIPAIHGDGSVSLERQPPRTRSVPPRSRPAASR